MTIFNQDGSLSASCGNGTRCVAHVIAEKTGATEIRLATSAGRLDVSREGPLSYKVDMGRPRFDWADIPLAHEVGDTRAVDRAVSACRRPRASAWAIHTRSSSCPRRKGPKLRSLGHRSGAGARPAVPAARQYFVCRDFDAGAGAVERLGARDRLDPGLRHRGLRDARRGRARRTDRALRENFPAGRRSRHQLAGVRRPRRNDWSRRAGIRPDLGRRHLFGARCRPRRPRGP